MPSTRCFIALPAPSEIQSPVSLAQDQLKKIGADVRWEDSEKFHMTLKFLGNCEASRLALLNSELEVLPQNVSTLRVTYTTVGAFPDIVRPQVVWIGADPETSLMKLQNDIEEVCARLNFERDNRTFHPHITLGRVKGTKNLGRLTETLKRLTLEPIQARCTHFDLMRSDLKPGGSVYTVLRSFPFQA